MKRELLPLLPAPLAHALLAFLEEDLPRSADELSELLTVSLEYVGAVALADYLDGSAGASCARDASLNGWLITQLATGKVEAGLWARWTKLAVGATQPQAIPALARYVHEQDLDRPDSDLAWLLGFRNRVMHGGFVAPLPAIRTAVTRMTQWFAGLAGVFDLRVVGRIEGPGGPSWVDARGLEPKSCAAPDIPRPEWNRPGAVLLVDEANVARLALDPACVLDEGGRLELQHAWQEAHPRLFERHALASFFARYERERRGQVDSTAWSERVASELPVRGYVANRLREESLLMLLEPGRVVRLVGPAGSGRSTLVHAAAARTDRPFAVLAVEPHSVRQDPEVVARFTLQALSVIALGEPIPTDALGADGEARRPEVFESLAAALQNRQAPVLVIDDADLVGTGLYAGLPTSRCLRHARRFGATVVLVHRPGGRAPEPGDAAFEVTPLDDDALRAWGDPQQLRASTAGHLELLANNARGRAALRARIEEAVEASPVHRKSLDALRQRPRTANDVAAETGEFTPNVELALRSMLDHLVIGHREGSVAIVTSTRIGRERSIRVATSERTYALHPAVSLVLSESER
jgi:hypothetical protein